MTAKLFRCLILFSLTLIGCQSARNGLILSKFSVNEKSYNSLIVDRKPNYGLGKKDGCIIEGQIHLSISSSEGAKDNFEGTVIDVKDGTPLMGAKVSVHPSSGSSPEILYADSLGMFNFQTNAEIKSLKIQYVGYRTLVIDLSKRNLFQ